MIQSGFQGLTGGKQTEARVRGKQSAAGEKGATDLFDGKLQRCLEGMRRRLTAPALNTAWTLYLLRPFPPATFYTRTARKYLFISQTILSSPSFVLIHLLLAPSCRLKPYLGQSETLGAL